MAEESTIYGGELEGIGNQLCVHLIISGNRITLALSDQPNAYNAAYAKLQLLPKFTKVNLTFPIHVDIRENICQILMLLKYIHKTFLFPRMQGTETPGLIQLLITSSIETRGETRRVNTAITHIHILMTHCLFTQHRPSSSQYS